jgi:hypothetical protein
VTRRPPLLGVCVACFVLGSLDMIAFEAPLARIGSSVSRAMTRRWICDVPS